MRQSEEPTTNPAEESYHLALSQRPDDRLYMSFLRKDRDGKPQNIRAQIVPSKQDLIAFKVNIVKNPRTGLFENQTSREAVELQPREMDQAREFLHHRVTARR